jgi:hypothetical protein
MRATFTKTAHFLGTLALVALPLALPSAASATAPIAAATDQQDLSMGFMDHADHVFHEEDSPLIRKVHNATAKYQNINFALFKEKGWAVATPCVSGPDHGAMGVHVVMGSRIADGILDPTAPEALIYEPLPNGYFRLVGVEFIELADDWAARNPNGGVPAVDGNLMNLVAFPNRFGLPAFYELHVWAWEDNPKGNFSDWNTRVTCEKQPEVRRD